MVKPSYKGPKCVGHVLRMQWFQLSSLAQLHHSQLQEVVISMFHGRQRPNGCCQVLQEGKPQKHGMICPKNFDDLDGTQKLIFQNPPHLPPIHFLTKSNQKFGGSTT